MLKISIVDSRRMRCLVVEGKLIEPWASELIAVCAKTRAGLGDRDLIVYLKALTSISSEGEDVLLQLMRQGLAIRCCGVFAQQVVKQLSCRLGLLSRDG